MARFAFISHSAWGHVDFGGGSFARTAVELLRRGHSVRWLLVAGNGWPAAGAVGAALARKGLAVETVNGDVRGEEAIGQLRERLASVDACAIDRLARFASEACAADIPWAALGTDGGVWQMSPNGVERGAGTDSFWCASPFLNIAFLPPCYWGGPLRAGSHFLGCAERSSPVERAAIIATLGTTFDPIHAERVSTALHAASRVIGGEWRFLDAGNWQPYSVAFADARLAIGHGGNAFLWQAMAEGIPVLSVFSGCGDQAFGARAAARLGMGQAIHASNVNADVVVDAVRRLLVDRRTAERARQMRTILRSGGGVDAAATLLERLAGERAPLISCVPGRCCCVETGEMLGEALRALRAV